MEEKNKKNFIGSLKIGGILLWVAFAVVTSVYEWNNPGDTFMVISSIANLVGAIILASIGIKFINRKNL